MEINFIPPPNFESSLRNKSKKEVVREFEAIMIKQLLKEAMKPTLSNKSFGYRMYYDYFLEAVSKKMAESGGIGLGKFILEQSKDDRDRHSKQ